MYEVIKNVINNKGYKLEEILYKINVIYVEAMITEEQKTELEGLARQNANPENSYAPIQEQIDNIYTEINKIKAEIKELKGGQETEEPEQEEYPEYVQHMGAHDAYKIGDKVTYNGKKYICKLDNCVWNPDTYPAGWEKL